MEKHFKTRKWENWEGLWKTVFHGKPIMTAKKDKKKVILYDLEFKDLSQNCRKWFFSHHRRLLSEVIHERRVWLVEPDSSKVSTTTTSLVIYFSIPDVINLLRSLHIITEFLQCLQFFKGPFGFKDCICFSMQGLGVTTGFTKWLEMMNRLKIVALLFFVQSLRNFFSEKNPWKESWSSFYIRYKLLRFKVRNQIL